MRDGTPTHLIRWSASCDAEIRGHGFRISDTHEKRVKQAGYCWEGGLIGDKCRFGPRRLHLEGEFEYVPHPYHRDAPSSQGHQTAQAILQWTLQTLYGHREYATNAPPEPPRMSITVKTVPLSANGAAA